MKASVLTLETYKRLYNKDLMKDVSELYGSFQDTDYNDDSWIAKVQPIMMDSLRIAHIMIQEQNPSFMSYEDWIKDLDGVLDNPTWIVEVLKLAMSTFRTGLFKK